MIFRTTIYSSSYKFFGLLLVMILFFTVSVFAQVSDKDNVKSEEQKISQLSKKLEGTWQIQVINSRAQPVLTNDLYKIIIENRDANKIKYVQLRPRLRLMILPESEIKKPEFVPVKKIVFVSE